MSELSLLFNIVESEAVPADTILVLPGPRRRVEAELPDGTVVVERGETLEEYAQRCAKIRLSPRGV